MNKIAHIDTLVYYDGPQVIEGRDPIGGHYIGVAVEDDNRGPRFMIVGVAPEQLSQFRAGLVDLRRLILERPMDDWFIGRWLADNARQLTIERQTDAEIDPEFLPEDGFFLEAPVVTTIS